MGGVELSGMLLLLSLKDLCQNYKKESPYIRFQLEENARENVFGTVSDIAGRSFSSNRLPNGIDPPNLQNIKDRLGRIDGETMFMLDNCGAWNTEAAGGEEVGLNDIAEPTWEFPQSVDKSTTMKKVLTNFNDPELQRRMGIDDNDDVAFPEVLTIRILAYLSRKEYLTCKLVCKRWDALRHDVAIMRKALFSRKVTRSKIRSVSSGNFLDGRSIKSVSSGGKISLTPPRNHNLQFFYWDLIELEDGIYNIKSATSNAFIDGRHKGIGNGVHTKLNNRIDDSSASQNNYYKWRVKKHQNGCVTRYSIQSVSSGLYLDGRSPKDVGDQLFLTGRNPEGDNFLMWEIGFEN